MSRTLGLIREQTVQRRWIRSEALAILVTLIRLPPGMRRQLLAGMPPSAVRAIIHEWWWQARGGQIEPRACEDGRPWRIWALVAARGFGKTRAGAEWVWQRARETPGARIALVAESIEEAARVMIEGESGILAVGRCDERPLWIPSRRRLEFPSGALAFVYGAERPGRLRGPQHHFAWCDELAKWPRAEATWDNLMMGLRLGTTPRTVVTTTPAPVPALKRILGLPRVVRTHGRTFDNPDCAADFREAMREIYAGTRLGRQELEGELLDDLPGALWTRDMIEAARVPMPPRAFFSRVVIGVDPPLSAHGDSCGIVVCGLGGDGLGHVLADLSVAGERPEGWARRVAATAEAWDAQKVVAEKNAGGEMVESVLHAADFRLPVKLGHAKGSKAARAEPVALRFETGRAKLAGAFPELEDELCALTYAGFEGPSNSPDRADAMVWAMSELFETPRAEPRIRRL
ncbi:MAG TPA: terminase family protein [Allosphingosinicella sp.]